MTNYPSKPTKLFKPFPWLVLREPMAWVLVAVNLFPFAGNYFWGWDTHTLLLLYWSETVILWFFQSLRVFILLGRAAAPGIMGASLFFAFFMMFVFIFICVFSGLSHGVSSMSISSRGMSTVVVPAQEGQTHHLWVFLADLFWRQKIWVGLALMMFFHGLAFLIFWVKRWRAQLAEMNKPETHRPLDDLGPGTDPTVQMIADLKSRYQNLVPAQTHPSQSLRDKNLTKAMGFLIVEPIKRMAILFISVFIGVQAGILIPMFLSVLLGRIVGMGSFVHLDWWVLAFILYFKIVFDLHHFGRQGASRPTRDPAANSGVQM